MKPDYCAAVARPYAEFLDRKRQLGGEYGFTPVYLPDWLFPFQRELVEWATCKGRAAIFADCGMGKTPMQLVWAENVVRHTGGRVLIVAPLAVSHQTIREARKFGLTVTRSDDGTAYDGITITNYERLDKFSPGDYAGTVCDESSAIKSFDGQRRAVVTRFMRKQRYRLLATATAAPNDYIELGTSSEALGYLGHMDMLQRFFKNDQNTVKPRVWRQRGKDFSKLDERAKWRFKGHAEQEFWRWVASWARALRRPSDLGHDDDGFILPPLVERDHIVRARTLRDGMLFELPAIGLQEEREEQRRTLVERCERAAELINAHDQPAVAWCHLNDEGRMLARLIPGSVEVAGSDSDEDKERAFIDFAEGRIRVLVTKPRIGGFGLNWPHVAHMTYFPSHSYEQYYQAVRRAWRFGQERPVVIDRVMTEGGSETMANLQRKAEAAAAMFESLVAHMNDAISIDSGRHYTTKERLPTWLSKTN